MGSNILKSGAKWMLIVFTFFSCLTLSAQPKLYGVLTDGGSANAGTLFKIDAATQTLDVKHVFTGSNGANPYGTLLYATDGMLYGTTNEGGSAGYGTLFQYNPQTEVLTTKFNFDYYNNGGYNFAQLIQLSSGEIAGVCSSGGVNGDGTIWKFNTSTNQFTKLFDFSDQTGAFPYTGVHQASNGKLYGVTTNFGTGDFGTLYELNLVNNSFNILQSFDYNNGAFGYSQLIEVNGKLIGVTYFGGSGDAGTIFEYDLNTAQFATTHSFDYGSNGGMPYGGGLDLASNGLLYGTTSVGGQYGEGTLFSYEPQSGSFAKIHDFSTEEGPSYCPAVQASDGHLYGMTFQGNVNGVYDFGSIYKFDLATNTYTTLKKFDSNTGGKPNQTGLAEIPAVVPPNCNPSGINAGAIAFTGSYNPNISNRIKSTAPATPVTGNASVEYIWLKSLVNVPNTVGNQYWSVVTGSENKVELNLEQLVKTTYFIRCSRLQGCDMYWGETNIVQVPVDLCLAAYTKGGSIAFNGNYNPNTTNTITSVTPGSSDFGAGVTIEYIWLKSSVNTPNVVGNPYWKVVDGSQNQLSLNLSGLVSTTYYIRCARAQGCTKYWGETNIVQVPVDLCLAAYTKGGSIAFNGNYNPNTTNTITSVTPGSSDFGAGVNIEYIWLKSSVNTPNVVGNPYWKVVEGSQNQLALNLSGLVSTTYYIRCARAESCTKYWGETNIVTVPVDLCNANFIKGGSIAFNGNYNPNTTNTVTSVTPGSSDFGAGVNIEYIWLKSSVNTPNVVGNPYWKVVEGSQNQLALTLSGLVSTTYYIRCARAQGCTKYWGETNIVQVPVDLCNANFIKGGSIAFNGNYNPNTTNIVTSVTPGSSDFGAGVNIEYIWLKSSVNTPNVEGNPYWKVVEGSQNQLSLNLSGLVSTTYYIRCARAESCTKYWGETNIVQVPVDLCNANFIKGGSIAFNGNYNPNTTNTITSVTPGSSDFGAGVNIEYIWLKSSVNTPNVVGNPYWKVVEGSQNQLALTLSGLVNTTYYIRCARAQGCTKYWGETNIVQVPVDLCNANFIKGGSIAFNGNYNPNTTNIVTSVTPGSSDFGAGVNIEYIWLKSSVNTPNVEGNPYWKVVEGSQNQLSLTLSGLVSTNYYIRCAKAQGCTKYWGETNIVTVPVDLCNANFIKGGFIAFNGNYNPNTTNTITSVTPGSSDFGAGVNIEYIWLKSSVNTPNVEGNPYWKVVEGSQNQLSLNLRGLVSTTYYIRCARAESCTKYWGETNIVTVPVDLCLPDLIHGGEISFSGTYNPNHSNIISNTVSATSAFGSNVNIEYIWLSNDENAPFNNGNNGWALIAGSTAPSYTVGNLMETTYFIRCARVDGCIVYFGESNIVKVAVDKCNPDFNHGGEISFSGAYNPNIANVITNKISATSDYGSNINIEYTWLSNHTGVPYHQGANGWNVITGATGSSYILPLITAKTYFIRVARVAGCDTRWVESNIVAINVDRCATDYFVSGTISFDQVYFANHGTNTIISVADAASPYGEVEYVWATNFQNTEVVIGDGHWSLVTGSHSPALSIENLSSVTYFVRLSRLVGCDVYNGKSNIVTVTPGEPANPGRTSPDNYTCYPNPAVSGQATTIEFMNDENPEMEVRVFSINGSQSKHESYHLTKGEKNQVSLPLQELVPGFYMMEIRKGGKTEMKRLIIR